MYTFVHCLLRGVNMPSKPRSETVRPGEVALYHVWSRCVRRSFLCGLDPVSGKNFQYRRDWIRCLEENLAALFGIEIGFHAEESNHIHLVLRTRPDVVATWTDEEIVERWLKIAKLAKVATEKSGRFIHYGVRWRWPSQAD